VAPRRRRLASFLLLVALALPAAACGRGGDGPAPPRAERFTPERFYVERDLFLAADEPAAVPAGAASFLRDDDEVYGIVVAGRARAYPTTMLSYHHVVNDVIEGIPVAVTY
jgi:hypothetical protein